MGTSILECNIFLTGLCVVFQSDVKKKEKKKGNFMCSQHSSISCLANLLSGVFESRVAIIQ